MSTKKSVRSNFRSRTSKTVCDFLSLLHLSFLSLNQNSLDVNGDKIMKGDKKGTAKRMEVEKEKVENALYYIYKNILKRG